MGGKRERKKKTEKRRRAREVGRATDICPACASCHYTEGPITLPWGGRVLSCKKSHSITREHAKTNSCFSRHEHQYARTARDGKSLADLAQFFPFLFVFYFLLLFFLSFPLRITIEAWSFWTCLFVWRNFAVGWKLAAWTNWSRYKGTQQLTIKAVP